MGKNSKKKRRSRKLTKHHDQNQIFHGTNAPENIIMLKNVKHESWHNLFRNLTFLEVAMLLVRTHNFKNKTNLTITEVDQ